MKGAGSQPPAEGGRGLPSGEQRGCSAASQSRNWETLPVNGEMSVSAVLGAAQAKAEGGRDGGMCCPAEQSRATGRVGQPARSGLAHLCSQAPFSDCFLPF